MCVGSDPAPPCWPLTRSLLLPQWYENTNAICNALNGVPAPKLPPYLEERLKRMFGEIQEPFERNCPPTRKNFLSYRCAKTVVHCPPLPTLLHAPRCHSRHPRSYVLYKFCELLGEDSIGKNFQLLKSHEKLHAQDVIWKKICKDLQWEFIRSI